MKIVLAKLGILSLAVLSLSVSAKADAIFDYTLKNNHADTIASFELPASATLVDHVQGTLHGKHQGFAVAFLPSWLGGGLTILASDPVFEEFSGKHDAQLFESDGRGSDLLLGKFRLWDGHWNTLIVSVAPRVSAPEPSSALLLGVGMIAVAMLLSQKNSVA